MEREHGGSSKENKSVNLSPKFSQINRKYVYIWSPSEEYQEQM